MITISSNLHLEKITIYNQEDLMALMHEIYPPAYKHLWLKEDYNWYLNYCFSKENLEIELNEKDAAYYFVLQNSQQIGILRFVYNTSITELGKKNTTFIHRIYLSHEAQGKGIAKQLFNWIEKQAYFKKNKVLWLKAMNTQTQALKFYKKEGFKIQDTIRLDFNLIHENLRGMVLMTKTL